jgi:hypothetical protein
MSVKKYVYQEYKPVFTHLFDTTDVLTAFLLSEACPERDYDLIYNHKAVNAKLNTCTGNFILYNTEQLSVPATLIDVLETVQKAGERCAEIWDYSAANVEILKKHGYTARHVPLQISIFSKNFLLPLRAKSRIVYDVGFCGTMTDRRKAILVKLMERGLKVRMFDDMYIRSRDSELARCKVFINIHQTEEHRIFESIRCEPLLYMGGVVISEHSLDNDSRCVNVSYDELVDTVCAEVEKWDAIEKQRLEEEAIKKAAEAEANKEIAEEDTNVLEENTN